MKKLWTSNVLILGDDHAEVMNLNFCIGSVYCEEKRYQEASVQFKKALETYAKNEKENDPMLTKAYAKIKKAFAKQEECESASQVLKDCLNVKQNLTEGKLQNSFRLEQGESELRV